MSTPSWWQSWLDRARIGFSPQAAALELPAPRGVLLVGVQGCGKSLAARVIARRWGLPLLGLDIGRLFDKFVGESERRFRRAIEIAESLAPVVLWIDEIEKGLAPAGSGDADGGLSRRLFGSFLTWMQEKQREVFVVATANDLSRLPAELLRKGRFDEVFFVDLPETDERIQILSIHLRRHHQDPAAFDLAAVASATAGFSGAELERLVVNALLRSLQEQRPADQRLLLEEAAALVPLSVSRAEEIDRLRADAGSRFVPVRGPGAAIRPSPVAGAPADSSPVAGRGDRLLAGRGARRPTPRRSRARRSTPCRSRARRSTPRRSRARSDPAARSKLKPYIKRCQTVKSNTRFDGARGGPVISAPGARVRAPSPVAPSAAGQPCAERIAPYTFFV